MVFKNKVEAILIDDEGGSGDLRKLAKSGQQLLDRMAGEVYNIVKPPIRFSEKGKKERWVYLVDQVTGATVDLVPGNEIMTMRTDPKLNGKVLDSGILQSAFDIKPSYKMLVVCLIAGIFIGLILGLVF